MARMELNCSYTYSSVKNENFSLPFENRSIFAGEDKVLASEWPKLFFPLQTSQCVFSSARHETTHNTFAI